MRVMHGRPTPILRSICLTAKDFPHRHSPPKVKKRFSPCKKNNDPHEWTDLSSDPKHADAKHRLQTALKEWQADTSDPLADPEKLSMMMEENDAVFKAGRRYPKDGWQYLKYLAPTEP